jgi:hypothetical protein
MNFSLRLLTRGAQVLASTALLGGLTMATAAAPASAATSTCHQRDVAECLLMTPQQMRAEVQALFSTQINPDLAQQQTDIAAAGKQVPAGTDAAATIGELGTKASALQAAASQFQSTSQAGGYTVADSQAAASQLAADATVIDGFSQQLTTELTSGPPLVAAARSLIADVISIDRVLDNELNQVMAQLK